MIAKVVNDNSVVIGEVDDNGEVIKQYEVFADQISTEQKVLAWVYHLCDKNLMDICCIKSFINACTSINQELDVYTKD